MSNRWSEMTERKLHISLLGPRKMEWQGTDLVVSRRQPRAILYRLSVRPEPVSRNHLCLLLWPNIQDAEARRHLSNQIYNLRTSLPDSEILQTRGDLVTLDPQMLWSDAAAFEHLSSQSTTESLQQAVNIYRGPFLEGFWLNGEFDQWATQERRSLEQTYLNNLSTLIHRYTSQREYDSALECAWRYLEIDELAEDIHRRMIDLYAFKGDRSAALQQYEKCVIVLERELGVEPLPETQEVYRAILEDRTAPQTHVYSPPTLITLPSLSTPMVGRDEAMDTLRETHNRVLMGNGSAVLVSGEAGMGKTRLLDEFIAQHHQEGIILLGSGYEAQGEIPFLPLVEAVRPVLSTFGKTASDSLSTYFVSLTQLFPELMDFDSNPVEQETEFETREESQIFYSLLQLILYLARSSPPLILCLDDVQWTDKTTHSWLAYLARYIQKEPIMLLLAMREEDADKLDPLRSGLAKLNLLEEINLENLSVEDVEKLIHLLSGQESGTENFSRSMHHLTGGNPFFLLEVIRTTFENSSTTLNKASWQTIFAHYDKWLKDFPIPNSVTETVLKRMKRLHPTSLQVLEAGAVIGKNFRLNILQPVSGRSEHEVVDALDELASRQLVMMDEENYWFKHDLIRAVVEDNLNFGRKKLLHRRAGEVLVDLKSENPAQIAFHFIKAQETKKATRYLLQAGDQARKLFGHQEAVKHYQQALDYQKKHENFEGAARTLMRLGLAYQIGYDHSKAQDAYQESFNYRQQKLRTPIRNKSINPRPLRLSIHSYRASGQLLLKNYQDLDPSSLNSSQILMKQLFSSFINIGSNRLIQPEVARDWMISDDGRSYTFHLRKDATWSDGEPVTAYDFELAWNRVNDISKGFIPFKRLPTLTGARVRASNQHTLEIKLREPVEHLINLFGHEKLSPIPSHILKKYDDAWTQPENFITNGPFQLEEWAPGQCITLERSPSYFGNFKGNLSRVKIFQKKLSPADQLAAYQDGEIDILALQPETYQARFQHEEEYHKIDNATTLFLGFGKQETLFQDPQIRRALGLAIDKNLFVKTTRGGINLPSHGGFLPPSFPGYSPGIGLSYNPELARSLLADAGFPGGESFPEFELLTLETRVDYSQILKEILKKNLGINIRLRIVGREYFFGEALQAPMFIMGWTSSMYSPLDYIKVAVNYYASFWQDEEFEKLLKKATSMQDQDKRLDFIRKADQILMKEASVIPLVYWLDHYLVKPWVKINLQTISLKDAFLEPH